MDQHTRKIIHVDMDCFYAAVEVRDRPELAGRPVAVGGTPEGRGVIATANYEARKFGVRSAMASARALRLCPSLVLVSPHFTKYKAESRKVREIFERFTPVIEPLSLDEAYLDVSDSTWFGGSATRVAQEIRRLIREETGLTASAGVAPNKFLAKVASEWNKPDGLKVIRPRDVADIVPGLKIEKIFGVGRVTAERMHKMGIRTCADLQKLSVPELVVRFGKWGPRLHELAFGRDDRPVETSWERKSLSVEETFRADLPTLALCRRELPAIYEEWLRRMERSGLRHKIRGAFVKLKFFDFKQTTHETTITKFPEVADFDRLLEEAFRRREVPVRLIGLGVRLETTDDRVASDQLEFWTAQEKS
ncbi:MAG: DNA polymerase IV [Bdellovibrionaceae bacterium]|nr:DNA polymerase IV [Pseudobdellovibrionaceae bacterium]